MNLFARFMRNTGPARFFVPVGIILIVFGIIFLGIDTDNYEMTVGTITSVTECVRTDPEDTLQYDVGLRYIVDGKEYEGTFWNMSGNYTVGSDIDVYYNPDNPSNITNNKLGKLISVIMIALGVAAIGFGVVKTVTAFKKSKELDAGAPFPAAAFASFKSAPGVTEYYFRYDGEMLKPGYIIEDASRKVVFEGKMLKNNPIGARLFEFRNHVTSINTEHEVGHTFTNQLNDEFFSVSSSFKFDGKDVWDVIHEKGLRIRTDMMSKFPRMTYNVAKDGAPVATVETSSVYVHEDDEAEHTIAIPTGNMYYRFWTNSSDFDSLFLTIFAISETQQTMVE